MKYRKRVSISANAKKIRKKSENSENSSFAQSEQPRKCFRDSLDFDSPAFDSAYISYPDQRSSEYCDQSNPQNSLLTPTTGNQLMVPTPDVSKRRSLVDELERPIKAIKEQIPKVKTHFSNHRCSWMFMLITVVFVLSFIPRITIMVMESLNINFWNELTDSEIVLYLFFYRVYLLTNITNPFFYGVFDKGLRRELRILCCCRRTKGVVMRKK